MEKDYMKEYQDLEIKKYMLKAQNKASLYTGVLCFCIGVSLLLLNGLTIFPLVLLSGGVLAARQTKKSGEALKQVQKEQSYLSNQYIEEQRKVKQEVYTPQNDMIIPIKKQIRVKKYTLK